MKLKKIFCCLVCMVLVCSLSACEKEEPYIPAGKEDDKRVTEAIEILTEFWSGKYGELSENWTEYGNGEWKGNYLEIIDTRIINIKDAKDTDEKFEKTIFKDVDYMVEFELMSNFYNTAPYYFDCNQFDSIVVYKDGTKEVKSNMFNLHRGNTYETDYSYIIESIEDFDGEYDGVIEIE